MPPSVSPLYLAKIASQFVTAQRNTVIMWMVVEIHQGKLLRTFVVGKTEVIVVKDTYGIERKRNAQPVKLDILEWTVTSRVPFLHMDMNVI